MDDKPDKLTELEFKYMRKAAIEAYYHHWIRYWIYNKFYHYYSNKNLEKFYK